MIYATKTWLICLTTDYKASMRYSRVLLFIKENSWIFYSHSFKIRFIDDLKENVFAKFLNLNLKSWKHVCERPKIGFGDNFWQ